MYLSLLIAKILYWNILSNAKPENTVNWEEADKFEVMLEPYTCLVSVFMNLNYQRDLHQVIPGWLIGMGAVIHVVVNQDYTFWKHSCSNIPI